MFGIPLMSCYGNNTCYLMRIFVAYVVVALIFWIFFRKRLKTANNSGWHRRFFFLNQVIVHLILFLIFLSMASPLVRNFSFAEGLSAGYFFQVIFLIIIASLMMANFFAFTRVAMYAEKEIFYSMGYPFRWYESRFLIALYFGFGLSDEFYLRHATLIKLSRLFLLLGFVFVGVLVANLFVN